MKDLAIYCAGGFGREIYCLIFNRIKNLEWRFVGFFDDGVDKEKIFSQIHTSFINH